jgi:5-formyltetrahydrofolate cyclo-ligase
MAKSMADEKKYFREVLKESRATLSHERAEALSAKVQARLLESDFYRTVPSVVLYCARDNEVQTDRIFADAVHGGRRVYFPRLDLKHRIMHLVRVMDARELVPGAFEIPEPSGSEVATPVELGSALICVPGVAFSPSGQRLGRGGGYYDRLIAQAGTQAVTAGLAYSFQLLDALPESGSDRRLQFVITESTVYAVRDAALARARRSDQGGLPRCI